MTETAWPMGTERVTVPFPCTGVLSPARDVFVTCSGMLGSTPPPPPPQTEGGIFCSLGLPYADVDAGL